MNFDYFNFGAPPTKGVTPRPVLDPSPIAPVSLSPPQIYDNGSTLTGTTGGWLGSPTPTFSVRWLRNGQAVPGQVRFVYLKTSADEGATLAIEVTARNDSGQSTITSNPGEGPAGPPTWMSKEW